MTDKRRPTYDLEAFKTAFNSSEKLALTGTALRSAAALGFGRAEIVATIQTRQRGHFYKSMTALCQSSAVAGRLSRPLAKGPGRSPSPPSLKPQKYSRLGYLLPRERKIVVIRYI